MADALDILVSLVNLGTARVPSFSYPKTLITSLILLYSVFRRAAFCFLGAYTPKQRCECRSVDKQRNARTPSKREGLRPCCRGKMWLFSLAGQARRRRYRSTDYQVGYLKETSQD